MLIWYVFRFFLSSAISRQQRLALFYLHAPMYACGESAFDLDLKGDREVTACYAKNSNN